MLACAFFGHRNFNYTPHEEKIRKRIIDLIERGVTDFYSGGRSDFDVTCARIVWELKQDYPHIKNILVLAYMPKNNFELGTYYDESVYLLENKVPFKYAISHTNRKLVGLADYIISDVARVYGGARTACDYAERLYKTIFYIVDNYSYCDYDWVGKIVEEKMKDEAFRKQSEEENARLLEKLKLRLNISASQPKDEEQKG